ncbi:unnamed protein product [Sphagnum troendelagicum]
MAAAGSTSLIGGKAGSSGVDQLPKEMHDMKIRGQQINHIDDKEMEATVVDGNGTETGHIISTTIGGHNGQPKHTISYAAERIVGTGSFGIVFQVSSHRIMHKLLSHYAYLLLIV